MAVGCFIFSLVLFLIAGFYWLRAKRMLDHNSRRLRRVKEMLKLGRGNRDEKRRVRLREMQGQTKQIGQRRSPYHPTSPNARPQTKKQKKAIEKIYGGIR